MRAALFTLLLCLGLALAQTPYDEPIQQAVTDPAALVSAVDRAQEHVFVVSPALATPGLADALANAITRGVRVYLVVARSEAYPADVTALANRGVEVRTLSALAEGVMVVDYRYLFEGGLVSGSDKPSQYLDIDAFGSSFIAQFRALWQAAAPLGG